MATRRIISTEKTILDKDDEDLPQQSIGGSPTRSSTAPAVPADVIFKVLAFSFAMVIIPLGSYFLTLNKIFGGNSTYAGILAVVLANLVLVGYIVVAMNEDKTEQIEAEIKKKKREEKRGKAE